MGKESSLGAMEGNACRTPGSVRVMGPSVREVGKAEERERKRKAVWAGSAWWGDFGQRGGHT